MCKVIINFVCALILILMAFNVSGKTIHLTNGEWPPLTSEKKLPYNGIISRLVLEAFKEEGITVKYGYFPWKRAIANAKKETWDGSIAWGKGRADLTPDFLFSNPIITIPKGLFFLKAKPILWNSMADLKGKRIGFSASYFYGEAFEHAKNEKVFFAEEVDFDSQNITKLLSGRIDGFAMEVDVARYLLKTFYSPADSEKILQPSKFLIESPLCVVFPKEHKKSIYLLEVFNRGLQRLKDSGKYNLYINEARQLGMYVITK